MIVPERILDASRSVNEVLAGIDAAVKRLGRGVAREGESAEDALLDLKEAEPRLSAMRRLMREDLGVVDRGAGVSCCEGGRGAGASCSEGGRGTNASHSDGVEALVPERVASAPQLASRRRASADGVSGSAW